MEAFLGNLLDNSQFPIFSAFLLGLLTAISPCPLATNITAIGFISKEINNKNKIFINGLIYTLGRVISYSALAIIIYLGADEFKLSGIFQKYGEKIIGPILIIIGLFMFGVIKLKFPEWIKVGKKYQEQGIKNYWESFLLGILFALAFCPYSGVLYFGMLIPLTIANPSGLVLPGIFAIATGIPVIIFAGLIAYTISGVGTFYNKLKTFEFWFRKIIASVFIIIGTYYIIRLFI